MRQSTPLIIAATLWLTAAAAQPADDGKLNRLTLHYDRPAEHFEEALVIGNGTMGATIYGGTRTDIISLNDQTLWTGEPDTAVTTPGAHKSLPEIRALLDKEDYRAARDTTARAISPWDG